MRIRQKEEMENEREKRENPLLILIPLRGTEKKGKEEKFYLLPVFNLRSTLLAAHVAYMAYLYKHKVGMTRG